jgi:hypothetical protein
VTLARLRAVLNTFTILITRNGRDLPRRLDIRLDQPR